MKVIVASHAGFCFGVKRAVDIALKLSTESENKVFTFGQLIHNDEAVKMLEDKNIYNNQDLKSIKNEKVIFRSHGVSKEINDYCISNKIDFVDATCPFVKKIQKIAYEKHIKGYNIIIIGDINHPEVKGINGWCDNKSIIGIKVEDFYNLNFSKNNKYIVVAQTTIPSSTYYEIVDYFKSIGINAEYFNTICSATKKRQEEILDLSQVVEAMIIIGGKQSSNTRKLYEISKTKCDTFLIETSKDIDLDRIKTYDSIGIGAGASTPDFIIQEVLDLLMKIQ